MHPIERSKLGFTRIALAITTGIVLGCMFGLLFPKQYFFLGSSYSAAYRQQHSTSISPIINFDSSLCALTDRVVLSKADFDKLQFPSSLLQPAKKSHVTSQYVVVDKARRKLAKMLKTVAVNNEVIVSIITDHPHPDILEIFFNGIKRVGITNFFHLVFDNATAEVCISNGVKCYHYIGKADLEKSTARLKLSILRDILEMGYNVVYSDVDIIYLRNPFELLRRDSDVELMSNGDNNVMAYGFSGDKVKSMSIGSYNSGFFYINSGVTGIKLLDRVAKRISWESSFEVAFNEELFLPSRPGYIGLHASKRIMDFDMFTNSKVILHKALGTYNKKKAVIVQVSQMDEHKLPIMKALVDFFVNGKNDSLQPFSLI